jgi:hypothetical protein
MIDFRPMKLFNGALAVLISVLPSAAQITLTFGPETFNQDVEGTSVPFSSKGTIQATTVSNGLDLLVTLDGDLSGLQAAFTGIVQRKVNVNDDCGQRLRMHTVGLSPSGSSASIFLAGHFEQWGCPGTNVPNGPPKVEFHGFRPDITVPTKYVKLPPQKAFEQDGSVRISLTPEITNGGTTLMMVPKVTELKANGLLGAILGSSLFGPKLTEWLTAKIIGSVNPDNLKKSFPGELTPYSPKVISAKFSDLGTGKLGVTLGLLAHISTDQAQHLLDTLLKDKALKKM